MPYTKDMLVCDVVDAHPQAKDVLLGFGLPCHTCIVAYYETLEIGLQPHDLELALVLATLEEKAPMPAKTTAKKGKKKKS